ncbi:MAG: hypothetical protein IPM78_08925 [Moraxellaceae bacterium]|jgi:hypothetical protein|nr:hypothetical protein [Moraxellaceae bacterium]
MNIKQVLDEMFSKPSALGNISYQIKQPMLLSEGMAQVYHAWELSGVYLLLEHQESKNWNVPLEQASGKLLYVGKTQKNLCERIKSHFGMKNLTVETFENHRWHSVPSISDDVKNQLSQGKIVIYPIECVSDNLNAKVLLPELVEKQLLVAFVLEHGHLPILNLQF